MKGHGDQGGELAWRRTDARTSEEEAENKKIAAGCNRGPRVLLCGLSFRKSRERKEGRKVGGTEGGKDGESPSPPQMMPPYTITSQLLFRSNMAQAPTKSRRTRRIQLLTSRYYLWLPPSLPNSLPHPWTEERILYVVKSHSVGKNSVCVAFCSLSSKSLLPEWRALLLLRKISSSIAGTLPWHHPPTVSRLWLLLFSSCCCCCCCFFPFLVLFPSSLFWSDIFAGSWWKMRYWVLHMRSVLLWAMLVGWFGSFLFPLRLAACEACLGFCVLCAFWEGSGRDVLLCRVVKISSFTGSFLGSCLHRSVHNAWTFVVFFPPWGVGDLN